MTIRTRRNNPGQPDLDGRNCYGCGDDAQINVELQKPGGNLIMEIRLCGPCRTELRGALEVAPPPAVLTDLGEAEIPYPPGPEPLGHCEAVDDDYHAARHAKRDDCESWYEWGDPEPRLRPCGHTREQHLRMMTGDMAGACDWYPGKSDDLRRGTPPE